MDDSSGADGRTGTRPVELQVDLSAIEVNVRSLKALVGPDCRVMAVVKANGYGLGARQVATAALAGGASELGVACVDEGVELRRAGFDVPILVMGYAVPKEAGAVVRNGLTLVVHRERVALALERAADELRAPSGSVRVHLKVDTGLGRYGCLPGELLPLAQTVLRLPHLRLEGLMTHFADADSPDLSFASEQLRCFEGVRRQAEEQGIWFDVVHAANSAAAIALPEAWLDMVRTGITLSGHLPSPLLREKAQLRRAVTLRAWLGRVFRAEPGSTVGYGRTWRAEQPSIVGLVPVGYADGYVRALSNRAYVLVGGRRCPVIGLVSMDQTGIDLTHVPNAKEGDEVVLIGRQGDEEITADDVAGWADTISYEVLCGISRRVPRVYVKDGAVVERCDLLGCVAREGRHESS